MSNKSHNSIIRRASMMTVLSVVAVCVSFFKESVSAYYFGTGVESDALTLALDMPRVLFTFLSAAIAAVVVPIYSEEKVLRGERDAQYFFSNFATFTALLCVLITIIAEFFSGGIVRFFAPGLSPEVRDTTLRLFRWTLPAIAIAVVGNISTAVLNCHKIFCRPAMAPIFYNLFFAACLFAGARRFGIYAALVGMVAGMGLEFIYRVALRRRIVRYTPVMDRKHGATRRAVKMSLPVILGMAVSEVNLLVDKMVASFLTAGNITALNYASKISSGISTLLISGISEVIFPEFSERVAEGNDEKTGQLYLSAIRAFLLLLLPILAGGSFLRQDIVSLLYARGQFDAASVSMTSPLFAIYLFSILFSAIRDVSTKLLYAYGNTRTAMINSSIGVAVNIGLDLLLVKFLGAVGLALATTVSAALVSLLLIRSIRKRVSAVRFDGFGLFIGKLLLACLLMVLLLWGITKGWSVAATSASTALLARLVISIASGAAAYFLCLHLLKVEEMRFLVGKLRLRSKG